MVTRNDFLRSKSVFWSIEPITIWGPSCPRWPSGPGFGADIKHLTNVIKIVNSRGLHVKCVWLTLYTIDDRPTWAEHLLRTLQHAEPQLDARCGQLPRWMRRGEKRGRYMPKLTTRQKMDSSHLNSHLQLRVTNLQSFIVRFKSEIPVYSKSNFNFYNMTIVCFCLFLNEILLDILNMK